MTFKSQHVELHLYTLFYILNVSGSDTVKKIFIFHCLKLKNAFCVNVVRNAILLWPDHHFEVLYTKLTRHDD